MNKKINKILEFMQKNYLWITTIITGLSVVVLNVLKFIEYLTGTVYFSFYGLDVNLYRYNDMGFIYSLCFSFLLILALISLLYCFNQITDNLKNKKYINKDNILNLLIIIIYNLFIVFLTSMEQNLISFFISFILLIFMEIIYTFIIFRNLKENKDISLRQELLNYIKVLPFALIVLIILSSIREQVFLICRNDYRLIDDKKVIVYSNNDYYLTLDCEVNNNNLIIYKGTQEKIDNTNIYSKYYSFETVEIK